NFCGFKGNNTPAVPDPTKTVNGQVVYDGQPVCRSGSSADFNNGVVFNPARLNRHRILAGLQVRVQMVRVGGQVAYDVAAPADANNPSRADLNPYGGKNPYTDVKRQATISIDLGAVF